MNPVPLARENLGLSGMQQGNRLQDGEPKRAVLFAGG